MFKFSLSVRAYSHARRYGLPYYEDWETCDDDVLRALCVHAGECVLYAGRSRKTAAELMRAGGLGVYQIHGYFAGDLPLDTVRRWCDEFDEKLHV